MVGANLEPTAFLRMAMLSALSMKKNCLETVWRAVSTVLFAMRSMLQASFLLHTMIESRERESSVFGTDWWVHSFASPEAWSLA